ncbi:MAG: fluoride efflux transporter CrcB [Spirochaetota bacterium]
MSRLISIFLGGGLGAVSRFLVTQIVAARIPGVFPMGTLAVNATGSFAMGFIVHSLQSFGLPEQYRSLFAVGFIGAYTTFSTYALETVQLVSKKAYGSAAMNFLLNNLLSLGAILAGMWLCARILGGRS